MSSHLTITVIGASGDLAKKKTYPALLALYLNAKIPKATKIYGYARSALDDAKLRDRLRPFLVKQRSGNFKYNQACEKAQKDREAQIEAFLGLCHYHQGQYASLDDTKALSEVISLAEEKCIKANLVAPSGFTRLVVEKPFGRDTDTSDELSRQLNALFNEDKLYRIDHYLGKEMVQNILYLRFANHFFEPILNNRHVDCIYISFKEPFGTEGRGGYFDNIGIIRDVMQNHLLQVLTLFAMEAPVRIDDSESVRNEKVKVLKVIPPVELKDTVLAQYVAGQKGSENMPGYLEDDTVPKGSVRNRRWDGVPFIMRAGKALDQRKVEVRVQFKPVPGSAHMFNGKLNTRNELVLRIQPNMAVFFRTNVKKPGLGASPVQSEMDLTYATRYGSYDNPDAYSRLLLDVLDGNQSNFVRGDELQLAWRIFTPLLRHIEGAGLHRVPLGTKVEGNQKGLGLLYEYPYGSRGPKQMDKLATSVGYDASSLERRLKAGSRDERKGGRYTDRELDTYIFKGMDGDNRQIPDSKL